MDADDIMIDSNLPYIADGFIRFSKIEELDEEKKENGDIKKAVLLAESGKQIAMGLFHKDDIELGDMVRVRIIGESDKMYQVYYNSTSQSHGFVVNGFVWIPKEMVAVMTSRTLKGIADGELIALKCKDCGSTLVMACGLQRALAVCSKCKRVDHVV